MFSEKKPEPALKRWAPALLLGLIALGALGMLLYPVLRPETGGTAGTAGFNESGAAAERRQGGTGSGLELVSAGDGMKVEPSSAPAKAPRPSARQLAELCRAAEARIREMAERYSREHPEIAQYGRDWMSYPDLKKLNDDYMRDRDPAKFLKGLAASQSFPLLMQKYAGQGQLVAFVSEAMMKASPQELATAVGFMGEESEVDAVARAVLKALNLNPEILGATGEKSPARAPAAPPAKP